MSTVTTVGCGDELPTTVEAYRKALSHEVAAAELVGCAGSQLDPDVVSVVLDIAASRSPVARAHDDAPAAVAAQGVPGR